MSDSNRPTVHPEIRFRIGHRVLAAAQASPAHLLDALHEANARDRLPGLPPELDIGARDAAKLSAFVQGWPRLPEAQREALRGSTVQLDAPQLQLGSASAVTAARLAEGYSLDLLEPPRAGEPARLALRGAFDALLARRRIAEARAALGQRERQLAQAQAAVATARNAATLRETSRLQQEASSVAMVWRDLLLGLQREPGAEVAASEIAQANQAVARHAGVAPQRGGMP